jgi:hypothetical protein
MRDLIVVIPGILGSVLEREGKEVWGLSGHAMIDNLLGLGRNIQHLALPQGIGDQKPNDGVSVTSLMPDLHMLPGLWAIDGYGQLVNGLKGRFTLNEASTNQPGNLLLFPDDWRLSNVPPKLADQKDTVLGVAKRRNSKAGTALDKILFRIWYLCWNLTINELPRVRMATQTLNRVQEDVRANH